MSVLVKDMKMPIDCRECMMNVYYPSGKTWCEPADRLLAEDFLPIPYDGRPDWCPLVEVPDKHGRLIDADETLKRHCTEHCRKKPSCEEDCIIYDLLHLVKPAIEAEGE